MRLDGRLTWTGCKITSLATAVMVVGSWTFPVDAEPFASSPTIPSVLASTADGDTVVIPQEPIVTTDPSARSVWDGMVGGPVSMSGPSAPGAAFVDSAPLAVMEPESVPLSDANGIPCYDRENPGSFCQSAECGDPPGLLQYCKKWHDKGNVCWSGGVDAIILWRNAPDNRPLFSNYNPATPSVVGPTALNASNLNSDVLVAPRLSLIRTNCDGHSFEAAYLYAGNFYARRALPYAPNGYMTSPPGIYGNQFTDLNSASATLLGQLQSVEFNSRQRLWEGVCQFLMGARWLQWNETLTMEDSWSYAVPPPPFSGNDFYNTSCFNNLWGGQIGLDTLLLGRTGQARVESIVKAGAYYNAAGQMSSYAYVPTSGQPTVAQARADGPPACSFVGEVGVSAVLPITCNCDVRCGYYGLWLTGLAQPTRQLSNQSVNQSAAVASLDTAGTVFLQGLSLGLEGRW